MGGGGEGRALSMKKEGVGDFVGAALPWRDTSLGSQMPSLVPETSKNEGESASVPRGVVVGGGWQGTCTTT